MEFVGGRDGEWGVFAIGVAAHSNSVDDNSVVEGWIITADDVYCGPSAAGSESPE